ncbi:LysM peptidoglycan-binding domain-containing protein [Gorillibacterium massiliense]|uniref:LysM peptidoglycan-binding domain-containing protein n=1 Tax=Gorillibacterium massiliense TaxID=1280390 RepID=UPI001EE2126E|nr:LysM peptidoglycan-binding domain-containing protein [Gorillibacterium massiliense]
MKANAGASNDPRVRTEGHAVIDVGTGESLWSIARDHADGRNMKSYIRDLKQLNGLENNTLQIGQILYLP